MIIGQLLTLLTCVKPFEDDRSRLTFAYAVSSRDEWNQFVAELEHVDIRWDSERQEYRVGTMDNDE